MAAAVKGELLVAGSGKMARDVGLFFLRRGYGVTWISGDPDRQEALRKYVERTVRRFERGLIEAELNALPRFRRFGQGDVPVADVIVECVREQPEEKKAAFSRLEPFTSPDTLCLTASSSILPNDIFSGCVGLHLFYPVELTRFAEIVAPDRCPPERLDGVTALADALGLTYEVQSEQNAFAMNRLLLPLQAALFQMVTRGVPPSTVNRCSISQTLPVGHLEVMDGIGLDVLGAAVKNYTARMPEDEARRYDYFTKVLDELVKSGVRGRKNRVGLLSDEAAAVFTQFARPTDDLKEDIPALKRGLRALFADTCRGFVREGQCTAPAVEGFLTGVMGAERSPFESARPEQDPVDGAAGRPDPVVRAILTSIRNAAELPAAEALRRETELFCELAVRKAQARETTPKGTKRHV